MLYRELSIYIFLSFCFQKTRLDIFFYLSVWINIFSKQNSKYAFPLELSLLCFQFYTHLFIQHSLQTYKKKNASSDATENMQNPLEFDKTSAILLSQNFLFCFREMGKQNQRRVNLLFHSYRTVMRGNRTDVDTPRREN